MLLVTHMDLERLRQGSQQHRQSRKGIGRAGARRVIGVHWSKAAGLLPNEAQGLLSSRRFALPDL